LLGQRQGRAPFLGSALRIQNVRNRNFKYTNQIEFTKPRYLSDQRLNQERGRGMYEAQAPRKKVGENHVIKEFRKER
jgi:hypothetical protein